MRQPVELELAQARQEQLEMLAAEGAEHDLRGAGRALAGDEGEEQTGQVAVVQLTDRGPAIDVIAHCDLLVRAHASEAGHGALGGGPVSMVVPSGKVISRVRSGSSFSFQPWSWTALWWRLQMGRRLSRSVGPPCSHHQTWCIFVRANRVSQPGIAHVG